jgi:glycosyltransferase involved in cell wall biosynthesis
LVKLQPPASGRRQPIDITVLICTRNRADRLARALSSAAEMRIPQDLRWELIVVDNGSTDHTAEVVARFAARLPIRLVQESLAGLSNARNRGVSEARGRYICWTDDDVLIDPEWLASYSAAFARHPEAAVFGGRIEPLLEDPTPGWVARLADSWPLTTLLANGTSARDTSPSAMSGALRHGGRTLRFARLNSAR